MQADGLGRAGVNSVLDQQCLSAVFVSGSKDVYVVVQVATQPVALVSGEACAAVLP